MKANTASMIFAKAKEDWDKKRQLEESRVRDRTMNRIYKKIKESAANVGRFIQWDRDNLTNAECEKLKSDGYKIVHANNCIEIWFA